ncbi:MAG: L-2-hydroxyglutarate oxidase [Thermoleophilia bacterium]|nr:L-2-hydroxyglutarate oxidase [Thermoleophilia bacterium]
MTATRVIDVAVIGAGIVGLATAKALLERRPSLSLVVVEKESAIATHQTARNSGVIHSGVYYRPGSAKARLAVDGRRRLVDYCLERSVSHELCGKVIVATSPAEASRLQELEQRAVANGVKAQLISSRELTEREPHVAPGPALLVNDAGIVDFSGVAAALAADIERSGGRIRLGWAVNRIRSRAGHVEFSSDDDVLRTRWIVNCGGLFSDRLVALTGARPTASIMPFRGEYFTLAPARRYLCRHLVYPLPDPRFPFLGAHFSRTVDGSVHVGPNAVPALAREGYRWRDVSGRELGRLLSRRATYRLAKRYWRTGLAEIGRSLRPTSLVAQLQRLIPEIAATDLLPAPAGVRAQAVDASGELLDDFVFHETDRAVHVVNAPSPAATASLSIGDHIARRVLDRFEAC